MHKVVDFEMFAENHTVVDWQESGRVFGVFGVQGRALVRRGLRSRRLDSARATERHDFALKDRGWYVEASHGYSSAALMMVRGRRSLVAEWVAVNGIVLTER